MAHNHPRAGFDLGGDGVGGCAVAVDLGRDLACSELLERCGYCGVCVHRHTALVGPVRGLHDVVVRVVRVVRVGYLQPDRTVMGTFVGAELLAQLGCGCLVGGRGGACRCQETQHHDCDGRHQRGDKPRFAAPVIAVQHVWYTESPHGDPLLTIVGP